MRLLIISDLHGHLEKIRPLSNALENNSLDAIVVCGDITHFGTLVVASTILRELADFATVLFVPGNCDPPQLASQPIVEGAINLHARCLNLVGFSFIGIGGSIPTPFNTPFELTEDEIERLLNDARKECEESTATILVSHDPPYGTQADKVLLGHHVGSKALRGFMDKTSPTLVACGHIHESRAVESSGSTTVVNPGPIHRGYYAFAEIGERVTVDLRTLE